MASSSGPRVGHVGPSGRPVFAGAALLGWPCVAAAGEGAEFVAEETGATLIDVDLLLDLEPLDVAVVGSPGTERADHATRLLRRGVHVLAAPGLPFGAPLDALVDAADDSPASFGVAEPIPSSPGVQAWFSAVRGLGDVSHLSGRAAGARAGTDAATLDWSLLATIVLTARLLGWGPATGTQATAHGVGIAFARSAHLADLVLPGRDDLAERTLFELQAASPTGALRLDLLPSPSLERNGEPVALPRAEHPAETFGVLDLWRTWTQDLAAGHTPILDLTFAARLERLRAAAHTTLTTGRAIPLG